MKRYSMNLIQSIFALLILSGYFLLLPFYGTAAAAPAPKELAVSLAQEPEIRVGLLTGQKKVVVSANAEFGLFDAEKRGDAKTPPKFIIKYAASTPVEITMDASGVLINGKSLGVRKLGMALQEAPTVQGYKDYCLEVNKKPYRGELEVFPVKNDNLFTLVNILPLEQYLYGILPKEMSPDWPLETLKAQAVAARTYVMYNLRRHQADGYNVCATTDCQVYGGNETEDFRSSRAVNDTKGQVLAYRGQLISAPFHASSGGYTEDVENVWAYHLPYLRSVEDAEKNWSGARWDRKISARELTQLVEKSGQKLGKIKALELSPLHWPVTGVPDRTNSGRVKVFRLNGANGSVELTGRKLRALLNLPSTLLDIQVTPAGKTIAAGASHAAVQNVSSEEDIFVINGYGRGHGVGLAQWGARLMAEKNATAGTEYFHTILHHYYQDVSIIKLY
ncbi:MAG TPA: SpoIID/LytB domain-containing protein [Patescibacteria group bacterium]|nr:SpoIID/LytB domain-containing protein [Patescibacteria group bacterium]